jgi:hypothetical protein
MRDFVAYADFLDFWSMSMPDTPFGRDAHEKMEVLSDIARLEGIYDQTDALLSMLRGMGGDGSREALISHHLKRLPRLPPHAQAVYDEIEIFQVKKFLHNYRALMDQLPESVQRIFGFERRSMELEETLGRGGQGAEAFYVADGYAPGLAAVRAEILETDAAARAMENERAAEIKDVCGLDFGGRPFLVAPKDLLADRVHAARLLEIEPYDGGHFCVRPLKPAALLCLLEKRSDLARRERLCEGEALESISADINAEMPNLLEYRAAALAFDLAWARARMARRLSLARPRLLPTGPIRISKGRFAPCEKVCGAHDVPYTPLDATFGSGATVVFGSNMGGKTVVLQTAAFLQLAAQTGLFVPAEAFETRVFSRFHYIGETSGGQTHRGLSGFGVEMRQLMDAWQSVCQDGGAALLLMDEFARTTGSGEAEAILAAALEAISNRPGALAICSTHFHGLPRIQGIHGVRYLRMSGLGAAPRAADGPPGTDPIARIARAMTYRLVEDDGGGGSDAIAVARMLGLDEGMAKRAEDLFAKGRAKGLDRR